MGTARLQEKFARYENIVLVLRLIEMKRATMPVNGLRARLSPGTFPTKSNLAPVLDAEGILTVNLDTFTELASKMADLSEEELGWLNRTLRGLAEKVAAEDEGDRG